VVGVGVAEAVIVFIAMSFGVPTLIPMMMGAAVWLFVG